MLFIAEKTGEYLLHIMLMLETYNRHGRRTNWTVNKSVSCLHQRLDESHSSRRFGDYDPVVLPTATKPLSFGGFDSDRTGERSFRSDYCSTFMVGCFKLTSTLGVKGGSDEPALARALATAHRYRRTRCLTNWTRSPVEATVSATCHASLSITENGYQASQSQT